MKKHLNLLLYATTLLIATSVSAKVSLPTHFTNNMVLQQNRTLTIKGTASLRSTVTLTTGWGEEVSAEADWQGNFTLQVQTPKASNKAYTMTFDDGETTTLENVLIGEVWLGSGQSNMEMPIEGWGKILNYKEEIKNANYPKIRLLQIKKSTSLTPQEQVQVNMGGWQECSPEHVPNFSALCYFYAVRLWEELNIPIGVIDDDWGGTPAESWVSAETLAKVTGFEELMAKYNELGYDKEAINAWHQESKSSWVKTTHQNHPTVLYNAMIHPLIDFPIKGVIWYQGCSNVNRSQQYKPLFQALIHDWRRVFKQPEMPFYFVQLANYLAPSKLQPGSQWALLREAQADALCLPHTGMAVNIDLGDPKDIHPKTKRELGRRLSAVALNQTYGKNIAYTAPIYKGYTVVGREVHIQFDMPKGSEPLVQEYDLPGFIIQGPDLKWHVAQARTTGADKVVVTCPDVQYPVAVRYGWADNPTCTLRTESGLHVAPFRTDI